MSETLLDPDGLLLYPSAITLDQRARAAEIRARTVETAADGDLAFLVAHAERLQREADDLTVLYGMTVVHATAIENELLRRNTEISAFLAAMNHELRTPLNVIIGYAELVDEVSEDHGYDQIRVDLQRISTTARHLLALVRDVLDLSKIEAGHLELVYRSIDVGALLDELAATLEPLAERRGNRLWVRPACGTVHADPTRLRQCLINLVGNAAKFTESGEITLSALPADGGWRFEVADTGIGMTREQLANLFQPFRQATPDIALRFGGTGLGLALTRQLVEAMGGKVEARSEPERGSTFVLWIPDRS